MDSLGSRKLAAHIDKHGMTLDEFAARVGTTKALVSRWRSGSRVPGLKFALLMQQRVGIPASSWLRPAR